MEPIKSGCGGANPSIFHHIYEDHDIHNIS